jgi:HK97 family phage prohead protease
MPIQVFALEVKSLQENGTFRGFASVYGNTDLGDDVVVPGAFTKTLQDGGRQRPLLWQHRDPVGTVVLTDGPGGLVADGTLTMAVRQAREAHALMLDGAVKGLSIGFQTIKERFVGAVRELHELKLHEVSLVTFPMNLAATVTSVKQAQQQQATALHQWLRQLRGDVFAAYEKR